MTVIPPAPKPATSTSPTFDDGTVSVIDPATNNVIDTITVGNDPVGVAVSPTGPDAGDIYVTNAAGDTVSVIDPDTNTVIDTITVGRDPAGVAVVPPAPKPATSTSPTSAAARCW